MSYNIRHAYLICAHSNYKTLGLLLRDLDSSNVDIYLHIDLKSQFTNKDKEELLTNVKESNVYFSKRMSIQWGGISQTKMFLMLIRQALATGKYDYLHMLTGQTLPIKSKKYIENFYDQNFGKEFVHFSTGDSYDRVKYYCPYTENCLYLKGIKKYINIYFILLQQKLNIDVFKRFNWKYKWGSAYGSITESFAKYLISQENKIEKCFSHTKISCESYLQTVLWNSPFKENIFALNEENKQLLYVNWDSRHIHGETIKAADVERIVKESTSLWACKFNDETSYECFNKILKMRA